MLVYRCLCEQEYDELKKGIIKGSPNPELLGFGRSGTANAYNKKEQYKHFFLFAEDAFEYMTYDEHGDYKYVIQLNIPSEILEEYLNFGNYSAPDPVCRDECIADNEEYDADDYKNTILPEFSIPISLLSLDYIKAITNEIISDWDQKELHDEYLNFVIHNGYYLNGKHSGVLNDNPYYNNESYLSLKDNGVKDFVFEKVLGIMTMINEQEKSRGIVSSAHKF